MREDPHILWYVLSIGISNEFTDRAVQLLKTEQTVVGRLSPEDSTHPGALRVLVKADPLSESTLKAAQYWVGIARECENELKSRCLGVLALTELDFEHYKGFIVEEAEWIRDLQLDDGSFSTESSCSSELLHSLMRLEDTSYAIWALSTVLSPEDRSVQRAVSWIHQIVPDPENHFVDALQHWVILNLREKALALIALLSVGEGPKIPMELVEVEMVKQRQKIQHYKPKFLHTSPIYIDGKAVKGIHEQIDKMLKNARKTIRISSPFIDVFYDEIVNLLKEKPELVVKIIARPKSDISGQRKRIAENAIDQLSISTRGKMVTSKLVHSRLVIIDEDEMLVSSADLTRDSLFDEFNAGIWTKDKKAIGEAIAFFDNLYDYPSNLRGSMH